MSPSRFPALRAVALGATTALLLAGCGGSSDSAAPADPPPAPHISGVVDGSPQPGDQMVRGWWQDEPDVYMESGHEEPLILWNWSISIAKAQVGTYECSAGKASVQYGDFKKDVKDGPWDGRFYTAGPARGTCSVTVDSVSDDWITGTFTATVLTSDESKTKTVTDGSFRVPHSDGPPPA